MFLVFLSPLSLFFGLFGIFGRRVLLLLCLFLLLAASLHHGSRLLGFLEHLRGFVLLRGKELLTLRLEFFDDRHKFSILLQVQPLDRRVYIFLLDAGLVKEVVVCLELFDLNDSVDHLGGYTLRPHKLIHLLLGFELGGFETTHTVEDLFTVEFPRDSLTQGVSERLDFLLVNGALGWVHKVGPRRLLKDLLGHLEGLIKVCLNNRVGQLFPVGRLQHQLLELVLFVFFDGCAAFHSVSGQTLLGHAVSELDHDLARLQEVVKSHRAVLFVLGFSKEFSLSDDLIDDFLGRGGSLQLGSLFGFLLRDDDLAERLELLVVLELKVHRGTRQVRQVEAEFDNESIARLRHFDGLNFGLSLRCRCELQCVKLAEHFHVAFKFEL